MSLPPTPILACSHHKSGANFTLKSFKSIANDLDMSLWLRFYEPADPPEKWDICLHQHGRIIDLCRAFDFRGWHCIRHPMALIYSAMLYHQKCKEPWVDVPLENFSSDTFWAASDGRLYNQIKDPRVGIDAKRSLMAGNYETDYPSNFQYYVSDYELSGMSYREFLGSRPTIQEKLLFEMRTYSRGVLNDMINFPKDERFFDIRLEEISHDAGMVQLTEALRFLGFSGKHLLKALQIFSANCLWNTGLDKVSGHATTGVTSDWEVFFVGDVLREYRRLFGYAESALGYF